MTRPEALEEVARCARLHIEEPDDPYYRRELEVALEELDRATIKDKEDK